MNCSVMVFNIVINISWGTKSQKVRRQNVPTVEDQVQTKKEGASERMHIWLGNWAKVTRKKKSGTNNSQYKD